MSSRGKALIVDDNVALARVTQFALTRAGFDAKIAGNGRKALELAQAETFDLVISDQQMPEMTGLELCRRLRATVEYAHTPIVLLTAKGLELELPALQRELNISAIFPKPFSPSEVVSTACQLLDSVVSSNA
jgi:two-component system alkaline phosphatase synthesis response regulator PhoP